MMAAVMTKTDVYRLMGLGYRLRVSRNPGGGAAMIDVDAVKYGRQARPAYQVPLEHVEQLAASRLITKLTEHGEGSRMGWRAAGYDGDQADWWVCTQ
jgi:hypothetical protein